jgi:hypothetical protein
MIMNAKQSPREISRDAKARGRPRSRRLELYTRSIFAGLKKKSAQPPRASAACGGRLRCGCKIDGDEIKKRRRETVHRTGAAPVRLRGAVFYYVSLGAVSMPPI